MPNLLPLIFLVTSLAAYSETELSPYDPAEDSGCLTTEDCGDTMFCCLPPYREGEPPQGDERGFCAGLWFGPLEYRSPSSY